MIKLAMIAIHGELARRKLKTRMLLQVHDELVFDLYLPEQKEVLPMVEEKMKAAIPLGVPMVVEMGAGDNWLAAHWATYGLRRWLHVRRSASAVRRQHVGRREVITDGLVGHRGESIAAGESAAIAGRRARNLIF